MSKNYMAEVASLLGVKLGERFKVKTDGEILCCEYVIRDEGLFCVSAYEEGKPLSNRLEELLTGEAEIVKQPWKPKCGETYHCWNSYVTSCGIQWTWLYLNWENRSSDIERFAMGNCFQSYEEAMEHKDEVIKRYKDVMREAGE